MILKKKARKHLHSRALAAPFGSSRIGNGECASLSSTAPTPGHLLQRFEKVNKLPIRKRPEGPGVMGANKAPAIGDQAVHRLADTWMKVSAG